MHCIVWPVIIFCIGTNVWSLEKVANEKITNVALQGSKCALGAFSETFQVGYPFYFIFYMFATIGVVCFL